jgi:DUF1365 family protein
MEQLVKKVQLSMGQVRHARLRPSANSFRYGDYTLLLPLRTLGDDALPTRLCSRNRFNLLAFYDSDHGDGKTPLLSWIDNLLKSEGVADADGEIWLQTFPRVLGYVFNPVSFWFCHRKNGELRAILCAVSNTFGEKHYYLLDTGTSMPWGVPLTATKIFHVSPFCAVEGKYRFRFMRTTQQIEDQKIERIVARIDYDDTLGPLLLTSISGNLHPISDAGLAYAFLRFPLMTFGVIFRIHWQAAKLFIKGAPFFKKPTPPSNHLSR